MKVDMGKLADFLGGLPFLVLMVRPRVENMPEVRPNRARIIEGIMIAVASALCAALAASYITVTRMNVIQDRQSRDIEKMQTTMTCLAETVARHTAYEEAWRDQIEKKIDGMRQPRR